jgi:protein Tex
MSVSIGAQIANELKTTQAQVIAAVKLLDEGATVPFISRYRKEATGGLDDTQLRQLEERLNYLRELEDRRSAILKSISDQEKLTPELEAKIKAAETKTNLEDLYLPYKPKRRTKGQIAIEQGLEPLADALFKDPTLDPEAESTQYVSTEQGVADTKAALDGAKYILMERFAEDADLLGELREFLWENGIIKSEVITGKEQEGEKFADYFEFDEPLKKIPSHRALALFRGRNEGILAINLISEREVLVEPKTTPTPQQRVASHFNIVDQGRAADKWLQGVVQWTWRIKLAMHLESELLSRIRDNAEEEAIKVFASNLKDLLMSAPAGRHAALGLDPGLRTGVKVVAVDDTGKLLHHVTIFPHAPQNAWEPSVQKLATIIRQFNISLVAIGNGTASRETDKLMADVMKRNPELKVKKLVVSEAGASVYSASELAAQEFPDLDVTYRGAVSIARRLQDPLAELVKIEPKAIGVGQYQHDVSQSKLSRSLEKTVEDCVNAVGVDLNTASAALLSRVSGLNKTLAKNVVAFRDDNGRFQQRKQLKDIPRLGEKAFEQCAGFLKITGGDNPLDSSSVHPEAYPLVERIMQSNDNKSVEAIIGNGSFLRSLKPTDYVDDNFGVPTVTDIIKELEKPGRDPRPAFKTAAFKEGVEKISDLKGGMSLEGVISNVTNFGAFVDIGVHQDGLVHISELADDFVSDPREVVKAGDIVKVKVIEVDVKRKRIGLSMRSDAKPVATQATTASKNDVHRSPKGKAKPAGGGRAKPAAASNSAFADALSAAMKKN